MRGHEHWEELVTGHALNALEPAEEAELTAHLAGCAHCAEVLAEHAFVAAQLGTLVDTTEAPSWASIRSGVIHDTAPVVVLDGSRTHGRRPQVWLGAAAALALVVGGMALLAAGPTKDAQQRAVARCHSVAACHIVSLQDRAELLIEDAAVQLLPTHLRTAPAGEVYVLWQLPRDGRPTMVATLDETRNGRVGEKHVLALPYASTAAFGLSLERADHVPTQPTDVLAVGPA